MKFGFDAKNEKGCVNVTKKKKVCVCGLMGRHSCHFEGERLLLDRRRGKDAFTKLSAKKNNL